MKRSASLADVLLFACSGKTEMMPASVVLTADNPENLFLQR
jgi:hypothetical protein